MNTFDDWELRAKNSGDVYFSEKDMEMAEKGLKGGLSAKTVSQILKIYGSSKCSESKYVKALMKTENIQTLINNSRQEENKLGLSR